MKEAEYEVLKLLLVPHPYSCDIPRKSPAASVDGFLSVTAHPQDLFYSKHL